MIGDLIRHHHFPNYLPTNTWYDTFEFWTQASNFRTLPMLRLPQRDQQRKSIQRPCQRRRRRRQRQRRRPTAQRRRRKRRKKSTRTDRRKRRSVQSRTTTTKVPSSSNFRNSDCCLICYHRCDSKLPKTPLSNYFDQLWAMNAALNW